MLAAVPQVKKEQKHPHDDPPERLVEFSDKLRKNQTVYERKLWRRLRKGLRDSPVWRQTVIHGYIVDFYFPDFYLAIELDGRQHDPAKDLQRDKRLFQQGVTVLRFRNPLNDVEVNDIISTVYAELRYRERGKNPKSPTNPQRLSEHRRGFLDVFKGREKEKPKNDKPGGNVEKIDKLNQVFEMSLGACEQIVQRSVNGKIRCQEQVYSSDEVADNMVRALAKMGITGHRVKCPKCGLIHVIEQRNGLTPHT